MNANPASWIRLVFWASALYDFVLGFAFLFAANALFERFEVPAPNHPGYVHFPALLLLVFAVLYARIALDPVGRRELIPYGIGLKAAYAGVVFYHAFAGEGVPGMWMPLAWIDVGFLLLFAAARAGLAKASPAAD